MEKSGRQNLSALVSSSGKNLTAVSGSHSLSEAMLSLALLGLRTKRSYHGWTPPSFRAPWYYIWNAPLPSSIFFSFKEGENGLKWGFPGHPLKVVSKISPSTISCIFTFPSTTKFMIFYVFPVWLNLRKTGLSTKLSTFFPLLLTIGENVFDGARSFLHDYGFFKPVH